jgi:hypothetical protein
MFLKFTIIFHKSLLFEKIYTFFYILKKYIISVKAAKAVGYTKSGIQLWKYQSQYLNWAIRRVQYLKVHSHWMLS